MINKDVASVDLRRIEKAPRYNLEKPHLLHAGRQGNARARIYNNYA